MITLQRATAALLKIIDVVGAHGGNSRMESPQ
jgi:hypothetical protein